MSRIDLPDYVEMIETTSGVWFRGTAEEIIALAEDIRTISRLPLGGFAFLRGLELAVGNSLSRFPHRITFPAWAWDVMSSKFREVAYGREEPPFDSNDCGFIWPPLTRDLGVELAGKPLPHLQNKTP